MINDLFMWLMPRVLSHRFQAWHLAINYSLLALALILYGLGLVGILAITLACLPGAAIFLVSLECLAWRMASENQGLDELLQTLLSQIR